MYLTEPDTRLYVPTLRVYTQQPQRLAKPANAAFDMLSQGLGSTILAPDFLYIGTDSTTGHLDNANIFQVDTTGNGAVDATVMNNGPLLRDTRHVPFSVSSAPGPADNTLVALGTGLADRSETSTALATVPSGTLALEAVLQVGLIEFTSATAASSAFGSLTDATQSDATETPVADSDAEFAGSVYSAALAQAASNIDSATDQGIAGTPEATVGTLDLSGVVKNLMATATLTAVHTTYGFEPRFKHKRCWRSSMTTSPTAVPKRVLQEPTKDTTKTSCP